MKTDHIKRRNMWIQVGLVVVTLGLYQFYWFYVTLKELHIANRAMGGAAVHTHSELVCRLALLQRAGAFHKRKVPQITYVSALGVLFARCLVHVTT